MAGVAQWITGLKDIRSGLDALNKPDFKKYIGYLDSVIEALEEYLRKEKYHQPESPADQDKIKEHIRNVQRMNTQLEIADKKLKKKLMQHQLDLTAELGNTGSDDLKKTENRVFVEAIQEEIVEDKSLDQVSQE